MSSTSEKSNDSSSSSSSSSSSNSSSNSDSSNSTSPFSSRSTTPVYEDFVLMSESERPAEIDASAVVGDTGSDDVPQQHKNLEQLVGTLLGQLLQRANEQQQQQQQQQVIPTETITEQQKPAEPVPASSDVAEKSKSKGGRKRPAPVAATGASNVAYKKTLLQLKKQVEAVSGKLSKALEDA